ncbi:MAG: HDOD domain-containing protein [Myxococcota bacterium]
MIGERVRHTAVELPGLPTLPEVVTQIVHVSGSERTSAAMLGALIETDHAVTTRVLRLANSSFYRRARRISSVRQAVVILGFETIRMLALSVSAFDAISSLKQSSMDMHDFWMHSFGAAACVRTLQQRLRVRDDEALCFTGALLHDVGKCIMAAAYGEAYGGVLATALRTGRKVRAVEYEQFGTHHGEVASWVCRRWNLPDSLASIPRLAAEGRDRTGPFAREVRTVVLADQLSRLVGFGSGGDPREAELDDRLMEAVGISPQALRGLLPDLSAKRDDVARTLQAWKAQA